MSAVTLILSRIQAGDPEAAAQLLPLVYDELRQLAASKLTHESPGHTLQATALVHEAWLRLAGSEDTPSCWENRAHFFAAAARAMRHILVDSARRKKRIKRGGDRKCEEVDIVELAVPEADADLLELDAALDKLALSEPGAVQLIQLRYFAGFTQAEAARTLGMSTSAADRLWAYARAWLRREMSPE